MTHRAGPRGLPYRAPVHENKGNEMTDTCKEDLRNMVRRIVAELENPVDVDDDGQPMEENYTWDADDEVWRDDDGNEADALDLEYTIGSDGTCLGGSVLVTFGGPNITIDTRHNVVRGAWWNHSFSASYSDNIGIDEACEELWNCK